MSYVEQTLSKDEKIMEELKLHWVNYITPLFCWLFFLFMTLFDNSGKNLDMMPIMIFIWIGAIYTFLRLWSIEMIVTNKRVVYKSGIIATNTEELKNSKIESVEIKQGILDRILGTGSLHFSGTGTSKVKFISIAKPWEAKSRIEEYIGD